MVNDLSQVKHTTNSYGSELLVHLIVAEKDQRTLRTTRLRLGCHTNKMNYK